VEQEEGWDEQDLEKDEVEQERETGRRRTFTTLRILYFCRPVLIL
jgi:hypothetical protein